jgi:hypothetical protein
MENYRIVVTGVQRGGRASDAHCRERPERHVEGLRGEVDSHARGDPHSLLALFGERRDLLIGVPTCGLPTRQGP